MLIRKSREIVAANKKAEAFGIKFKRFCEYNCLKHPEEVIFHSGDVVYLSKLRNRNWKAKPYTVQEGETLRDVALRFAVKPRSIQHMNGVKEGERLFKGQVLRLR